MPKSITKELKVTITFKPTRLQNNDLARAYEAAMPLIKRSIKSEKIDSSDLNCFLQTKK